MFKRHEDDRSNGVPVHLMFDASDEGTEPGCETSAFFEDEEDTKPEVSEFDNEPTTAVLPKETMQEAVDRGRAERSEKHVGVHTSERPTKNIRPIKVESR